MQLDSIKLAQFKSHTSLEVRFSPDLNFIVGPNGSGKTNLLEAIGYLCLGKSVFFSTDKHTPNRQQIIAPFFSVIGLFNHQDQKTRVQVSMQQGSRKQIRYGDDLLPKVADHVGQFPVVMIAPDDVYLIREGSEERRRFFDALLCQLDRPYLEALMRYNHTLGQRNALLKQFQERNYQDIELLRTYSEPLADSGAYLVKVRQAFLTQFTAPFLDYYAFISRESEVPSIQYESQCLASDSIAAMFEAYIQQDLMAGRTCFGPHKDDYDFLINDQPLKTYGSQGQQKSFLVALKLAQYQVLETSKGYKPLLLLDDIFDKLDAHRIQALLELVADHRFGQIFITDAQPERCNQWAAHLTGEKLTHIMTKTEPVTTSQNQHSQ